MELDKLRERLQAAGASNPNILEIYVSGHNPPVMCVWTVIPKWDYKIEVSVGETVATILAENPNVSLDPLIIADEIKDEMLPDDAQKIYGKS